VTTHPWQVRAFVLGYTAVWLAVVVLLWVYWHEWPMWVTWPLAILEAIFVPDWRTLKPYIVARKSHK